MDENENAEIAPAEPKPPMKSRPIHDRLLIRRHEGADVSASGKLFIPEEAREKPSRGEVLAAGQGRVLENGTKIPLDIQVGDIVLFGRHAGHDVELNGEKLVLVREDECLMLLAKGEF